MASQSCDQERFERLRKKYKHVVVRGMVMPPFLTEEVYEGALAAMPLRDGDVFISTYPKSGTTWTQKIVHLLRYGAIPLGMKLVERVPWHETQPWGELNIDLLPSPRTYKSHLDWPMTFKVEEDVKYVYIARNGKDVAVSLFHHVRGWKGFECTEDWDGIFEMFMAGDIAFGRWFEHVLGWWRVKDRDDVLYLFYEDMKEDPVRELRKISQFLGLEKTDEDLVAVAQQCDFQVMQGDKQSNYSLNQADRRTENAQNFIRKGMVGDWQSYFSDEQSAEFDRVYAEVITARSDLRFRFTL